MLLQRGSTGPEVLKLKTQLQRVGWLQTNSDSFDLNTEAAVRNFQTAKQLTVDGVVGKFTMEALLTAPASPTPAVSPIISICKEVKYFSQRDNEFVPSGTCNVTSLAMVLDYWGIKPKGPKQLEDELFEELLTPEGQAHFNRYFSALKNQGFNPRNVHGMLGWLTERRGLKWKFTDSATVESIRASIADGKPVITSGKFTASGHIIVLIGYTHSGFIVHDPWGDWEKGYSKRHQGAFLIYDYVDILAVLNGKYRAHFIEGERQ